MRLALPGNDPPDARPAATAGRGRPRLAGPWRVGWLAARLPEDHLTRARLAGLAICLVVAGLCARSLGSGTPLRSPSAGLALVGLVWLGCRWIWTYVRPGSSSLWGIAEGVALLAVGIVVGPSAGPGGVAYLALLYAGLSFRSLDRSCLHSLLGAAAYLAGYGGAVAAADGWHQALAQAPGIGAVAVLAPTVARALARSDRTAARERILMRASTALVAADDRERIYAATLDAIVDLLAGVPDACARVGVGSEDRLVVVAAAGPSSEEVEVAELPLDALPPAARDRLAAGATFDLVGEDLAAVRSLLAVGPTAQSLVVVPIVVREALRGAILVTSSAPLPPHARGGLRALAAQVALALESAALTDGLRRSEARFRSLVQNSSDVITVIETDTTIRYQSPSVARVLGYGPAELVGAKLIELIHPDDARRAYAFFVEAVDQPGVTPPAEWRLRCKDGSWLHVETVANSLLDDPTVGGLVLNTRDVSERKSLEAQIVHQAFHDLLTGLPNRALFLERLLQALERPSRREGSVAILFLDLDRFKVVNDSLGHEAGDQLLTAVATRLQLCVRPSDTVARLGGDEFALLLENLPSAEVATGVAARIVEQLQVPISLDGREVVVGTSIGIAFGTPRQERPDELLRNADIAMYAAKAKGRGCYAVFSAEMNAAAVRRLELESDLRRALTRGEFQVHYQPLVSLASGRVCELEALVRWQHPERGLLPPAEFIPLAEETGLIIPLGQLVLAEAARQARQWQLAYPDDGPITVGVNLSARQFQQPQLVTQIATILRETGLEPSQLKLEITESIAMEDIESTVATLEELKRLGIRLAIDDFGTGYSALAYLKRFPVDTLKIDRSFVAGVGEDAGDTAIVRAVIAFAKTLNLRVTAEGVETAEQLERLRALGCDQGQGYYFARPLSAPEMGPLLARARGVARGRASAVASAAPTPMPPRPTGTGYLRLVPRSSEGNEGEAETEGPSPAARPAGGR